MRLVFPDNTVFVHFARVGMIQVLTRLVGTNGAWCGSIRYEARASATQPGLESIRDVESTFGEPLFPETQRERIDVQLLRDSFAAPHDPPTKHLGEAETITLIESRQISAIFVTDDNAAAARANARGIATLTSWDIFKLAAKNEIIEVDDAWDAVTILNGWQRHYPCLKTRSSFRQWCSAPEPASDWSPSLVV